MVIREVSQRLAQYETRDEVTELQRNIDRLSVLVATLGRHRVDRSTRKYSQREYRRKSPSERELNLLGNESDDGNSDDRNQSRLSTTRLQIQTRARNRRNTIHGLRELEPSDPRFSEMLLYRCYRLFNKDGHFGPEVSRNSGVWVRRIEHVMSKYTFNGAKPVACLRFLSAFKKQLDNEGIHEAGALRIWPNFLSGESLELFKGQSEKCDENLGGFTT